jgi:GT2 family glycosyltransferase
MTEGQGPSSLAFLLNRWRLRRRPEAVIDRHYAGWVARNGAPDPAAWTARLAATPAAPGISVVMPVCETRPDWLEAAIASVRAQIHPKWELLIADDASASPQVAAILNRVAGSDPRIDVARLPLRAGISAASNLALSHAGLPYVTFLDHDDRLAPHALAAMACELAEHPDTDLAFSDEDQLIGTRRARPYFKPGWNPDLLLSQNLVCHLAVYRRTLVTRLGGLRSAFDGSQDFELALRTVDECGVRRVRHVPDVLYHWRQSPGSHSAVEAPACRDATRRALADTLGTQATVLPDPILPQWPLLRWALPQPAPRLSVIGAVPQTGFGPVDQVARAEDATGDMLLFLSGALRRVTPDWLECLLAQASRPEIGAAGARLDGRDGRLVHGGYVLDPVFVAHSPAPGGDAGDPGYRGHFHLARTVSAVSGDCLAVRRDVFAAAGGFSAGAGEFAAVDLCLKLSARGLRSVWVPQARLAYVAVPKPMREGAGWMRARWGAALAADPYHNPNLRLHRGRLSLKPR